MIIAGAQPVAAPLRGAKPLAGPGARAVAQGIFPVNVGLCNGASRVILPVADENMRGAHIGEQVAVAAGGAVVRRLEDVVPVVQCGALAKIWFC